MITVAWIPYSGVKDHPELLAEYEAECGNPVLGPANPQWEMYERMESAGGMRTIGVYVDSVMVGFATVLVTVLPDYGIKVAAVKLFVAKAHRDSGAGARLMAVVEEYARAEESIAIFYSAPAGGRLEAVLDKRYARAGSSYCIPLG